MKKSLLAIGLLGGLFGAMAQLSVASVATGATLYVGEGALMYNGGGVETQGSGLVDVHGNVMVEGQTSDRLRTLDEAGTNLTAPGSNIVLRMNSNDPSTSTYGQLYISGIPQSNITGFVRKEYQAAKHGVYQQMALPFYGKTLASLASNLGLPGFSNQRGNPSVMYWDNRNFPQFHDLKNAQSINDQAQRDTDAVQYNGAGRYFIVGTNGWDPAAGIKNIDGVPFSDNTPIQFELKNAGYTEGGAEENYMGGSAYSAYGERIRTYLQDSWDLPNTGFFAGTYGRNIYQFANPFLTNIDLSTIGYDERASATDDDGNNISNIRGVRYEAAGVTLGGNGNNGSTSAKYLTFDQTTGVPVGDKAYVIKPMQSFSVKLNNNNGGTLNFNTLRKFSYDQRAMNAAGQAINGIGVNNARMQNNAGTIKQLRVIGFDANGKEVARTYFVVGPNAKTGVAQDAYLQVSAFSGDLNTREELPTGGEDTSVQNMYWLYINEANQNDFVGKKVAMYANLSKIKNYRFEVAENAQDLANGQSAFTDGGKSFYIEQTPGNLVQISNNMTVSATAAQGGLYYGTPSTMQLATGEVRESGVSDLYVALNKVTKLHEVVFPKGWKTADINVFDMAGRKVRSNKNVAADKNFVIDITTEGAYVVEVVSNTGIKAIRKIVK